MLKDCPNAALENFFSVDKVKKLNRARFSLSLSPQCFSYFAIVKARNFEWHKGGNVVKNEHI